MLLGAQLQNSFFVEVVERLSPLRELSKQRRGFPEISVLIPKLADAIVHFLQPHRARVPHGSAAVGGETITVDVPDVDAHGQEGDAFLKTPGALSDKARYAAP